MAELSLGVSVPVGFSRIDLGITRLHDSTLVSRNLQFASGASMLCGEGKNWLPSCR